jgi:hypothetical protein
MASPFFLLPAMKQTTDSERRRLDRRRSPVTPPPFRTSSGLVLTERRARVDRRNTWVRDIVVETDGETS